MSSTKFCSNCGSPLKADEKFCAGCGTKVEETPVAAVQPVQQQPVQVETVQPTAAPAATPVHTPPTQEVKNKLILWMILSIFIPIIGIVLGIIMYRNQDKQSGMHYLLCGLSAFAFVIGTWTWAGWILGAVLVASAVYNGIRQINAGVIKLPDSLY